MVAEGHGASDYSPDLAAAEGSGALACSSDPVEVEDTVAVKMAEDEILLAEEAHNWNLEEEHGYRSSELCE